VDGLRFVSDVLLWERFAVVGGGVKEVGLAHAFAFVIDDDARGGIEALKADVDLAVGQVAGSFVALRAKGKGVVGADLPGVFDEEEFVISFVGREVTHTGAIESKTIKGRDA